MRYSYSPLVICCRNLHCLLIRLQNILIVYTLSYLTLILTSVRPLSLMTLRSTLYTSRASP